MPMRTFVYRLKPTRSQHVQLSAILEAQRSLYNAALEERIGAWRSGRHSLSFNDQTKSLTEIRKFDAEYGSIAYNVSKWTLKRLDLAMQGFFNRVQRGGSPGFPRFRPASRWCSFGYQQKDGLRVKYGRLLLVGMAGGLKMKMHRPLLSGEIKSAVFTLERGIWRVAIVAYLPIETASAGGECIGVDVGVAYLATTCNGTHFENVRARSKRAADLARAQRALARCKTGSQRRRKVKDRLAKAHAAVRNQRTTHLHGVANAIVRMASTIYVEDLKLARMTRSAKGVNVRQKAGLNRAMADAAPGRLINMLIYKAESAGGLVVKVGPRNTSRTCSNCGVVDAAQAGSYRYRCECGLDLQRDHNAAINIKARGIAANGAARCPGDAKLPAACPGTAELLAA